MRNPSIDIVGKLFFLFVSKNISASQEKLFMQLGVDVNSCINCSVQGILLNGKRNGRLPHTKFFLLNGFNS